MLSIENLIFFPQKYHGKNTPNIDCVKLSLDTKIRADFNLFFVYG